MTGTEATVEVAYTGVGVGLPTAGLGLAIAAASVAASAGIAVGALGVAYVLFDLAKQKYSNREYAHAQLSGHVWSLIDDVAPQPPDKPEDLAAASLYLLREGTAQLDEMRAKLSTAAKKFDDFWSEYTKLNWWLTKKDVYDIPSSGPRPGPLSNLPAPFNRLTYGQRVTHCLDLRDKAVNLWNTANEQNGAVFDLMRRLNHFGNYLQAPMIVAQYLNNKDATYPQCIKDQFNNNPVVKTWRDCCYQKSDQLEAYNANFKTFADAMEKRIGLKAA
jgi:hypothetical protein